MRKKLWSVILTAAIAVGALAGCGQTGTIAATDTTQEADTTAEAATDNGTDAVAEAEDFLVIDLVHILVPDRIQHVLSVLGDLVEQICLQILIALVHLKLLSAERAVLDVLDVGGRRHVGADGLSARAVD